MCKTFPPPKKKDRSNIGNNTNVVCRGASSGPGAFLASSAPPSRCLFISLSFSDSLGETCPDLPGSPNTVVLTKPVTHRLATQMVALLTQNCQPFARFGGLQCSGGPGMPPLVPYIPSICVGGFIVYKVGSAALLEASKSG